jgi:hypothetical protein
MRSVLATMAVLLLVSAPAAGSELEQVGTYGEGDGAAEIEVAGNLAFLVSGGVDIVSIADPARPKRIAKIDCDGTADVALDPAAQILVLGTDSGGACLSGAGGIVVYDIRDPANPEQLSAVAMPAGAHTVTMDGRTLYANQPDETGQVRQLEIFDLADPAKPRQLSVVPFPGHGPHESFVRHRPDGRSLLYTSNVTGATAASVLDVTDPAKARILQTISDPSINYAHQAEVSFDDEVILVSDELLIGSSYGACGKTPGGADTGGALHFYAAAPDGTFASDGAEKLGTYNVPAQASGADQCTVHNFMQSPDSRRALVTWYSRGTRLVDFSDAAKISEMAAIVPQGGRARAAIAHNGHIYTADVDRSMDVLRFRGQGWPATAAPAEAHRFGTLPRTPPAVAPGAAATLPPAMPAPRSAAGRARFSVKLRRRAQLAITDARGVQVAVLRVPRRARVSVTGLPGRYRWTARAGGKRVGRGSFSIRRALPGVTLAPGQVVLARRSR